MRALGFALLAWGCTEQGIGKVDGTVRPPDTAAPGTADGTGATDGTGVTDEPPDSADPCEDAPETESACDGQDEDCDGETDEGEGLEGCTWSWPDGDGDGVAGDGPGVCSCAVPAGNSTTQGDCDDADDARQDCRSCADILARGRSTGDGRYPIDPDGDGAVEVRCDMTTDGGGWTLLLSVNARGLTQYDRADILETTATVGALGDANHMSPAFSRLDFSESFVQDTTHSVAVPSDTPWTAGALGPVLAAAVAGTPTTGSLWQVGARSRLQVRSSATTDGLFAEGDLRVHFIVNQGEVPALAFPVTLDYRSGERHLVFDSAFGVAGARIYGDPLYDVATTGVDETFTLWVR